MATCSTITDFAVKEAGSTDPLKRARMTAVVEKPSSVLTAACPGGSAFSGWILSVPSVEPAKYRSVGYGRMPCRGWNSAAVAEGSFTGGGLAAVALTLAWATATGLPALCPPEHALSNSAAVNAPASLNRPTMSSLPAPLRSPQACYRCGSTSVGYALPGKGGKPPPGKARLWQKSETRALSPRPWGAAVRSHGC
jgi:hypothetical protein